VNRSGAALALVGVVITPTRPVGLGFDQFATYTRDPFGLTARPTGLGPSTMVATTVFVAVAITDTVLLLMFVTYTRDPSGVTATPVGRIPTGTVATTVFTAVSIADTVPSTVFATYTRDPS